MNRKRKSLWMSIVLMLLLSLALVGCGNSNQQEAANTDEAKTKGKQEKQEKEEKEGGIFVIARSTGAEIMDPGYAWNEGDMDIVTHLYDGLVRFKNDQLEVEPALATEWDVSEDGKTWTFKLRQGVKFHDGSNFTADDVVFSFMRVLDENHPQYDVIQGGWSYLGYLMGDVINDVRKIDDYTVEFDLNEKFAPFLTYMGYYSQFIVSQEAFEKWGADFVKHPTGTGPFKYEKWNKGEFVQLVANENYWGEKAKIDKLVFKVVPESSTRLLELQTGQVDAIKGIDPAQIEKIKSNEDLKMLSIAGANIAFVGINTTKEPFNNVKVRQAMNYAIDMDKLVDSIYEGNGTRATNLLPPTVFSFDDTVGPYEYNPEKAKQLLSEAGYPDGFEMEFHTFLKARPYISKPVDVAEVMKADLENVGIKVKIITNEFSTLTDVIRSMKYDVAMSGWYDVPYPSNFLKVMALEASSTGYAPDDLIELANKALSTYDRDEQVKLYQELQQKLHEAAPMIPIAHNNYTAAVRSNVEGFKLDVLGFIDARNAVK
jgi:peptide/nickel transport system substrate-binding protein